MEEVFLPLLGVGMTVLGAAVAGLIWLIRLEGKVNQLQNRYQEHREAEVTTQAKLDQVIKDIAWIKGKMGEEQ